MKINTDLGYKPTTFSELTQDDRFWQGCQSCPNFDILNQKNRKMCLCTGMLFNPIEVKRTLGQRIKKLNRIIFDPLTGLSFGIYRQRGKLVSRQGIITWLSTKHTKEELKKIYPNISIILLNSPELGDFEKNFIDILVRDTKFIETDDYKMGIFNSGGSIYRGLEEGQYYFLDWKSDKFYLNIEYIPLNRWNLLPRSLPLTIDVWREIRLNQIL